MQDTYREAVHPLVQQGSIWSVVSVIWNIEKYFGMTAIGTSLFINFYMFMFALKGWGVIQLPKWLEDIVFFLDSEDHENVLFVSIAEDILDFAKAVAMTQYEVDEFKPANEDFLFSFNLMVYPMLWVGTSLFALVQIFSMPFWAVLYVIDKDLFVDA